MARNHPIKILWYGSETDAEGNPIIPKISPSFEKRLEGLNEGEIYIHNDDKNPSIYIRTNKDRVVAISGSANIEELSKYFLRKDKEDIANGLITFLKGLRVGQFVTGLIGGSGAAISIDANGKTIVEADKAMFREELIVPQITFNCIDVISGDKANTFAYGTFKTVDKANNIATLDLLEDQWGTLHVSDICRGVFHDLEGGNKLADAYDDNGFLGFSGFATSYFTPTEIIESEAGSMTFKYALQVGTSVHPLPGMNFFAYGNFIDKDRQAITYENRYYTRRLVNVNTWVIDPDTNIAYQSGDLSGLTINGQIMDGYSSYQKNVYVSGTIERLKPNGEVAMDLSYEGVWQSGKHYDYYDSVTHNGSTWACLNKNGSSSEPGTDADWQEIASKGDKGDGYTQMGQFKTGMVVPKMGVVSMGGGSYVAKASTTNPPLWCWTDNAGNRFTFNDGGYVLTGEVNTAEYDVLAEPGRDGTDGINGTDGVPGTPGKDGKTYYTWIRYADDDQGNGISNDPTGKAYIGLAYNKETAVESNNPSDYKWSNIKGEPGVPGAVGADGKTYYTWIAYSDNADGSGMYQQPNNNTKYIGIAVNKETATESSNPADYTWSQFKGNKGDKGDGYTQMGQFKTGMVVPKMGVVSMGGGSYVAKASTTNPPLWCWTDNAGNRFTFADGGYVLTGEVNTTEYDVWSEKGDTGEKGDKGDKGDDGEKGDKGDQGVQGIQGCIFRESEWSASSVQYRNDEALTSGTRYIDFALIRNDAAIDGWDVYKCLKTHVSSASNKPGNTTYWEKLSGVGPIYTSLIIAKNASISLFQGNQVLIKKSDNTVTAGMSGSTSGQKIRIWAGSTTPDSSPFRVNELGEFVSTKANITGTITATGGNIGGFNISTSSMESVSGNNAMLLSANLVRFTGSYSSVFIGADTFPSSSGGAILCPSRISVNRNITNTAYGNVGMYFDIQGSHAYDDNDFQYTGNHALYIVKGDICGFRLRLRRISKSTTLSVMDSVIMAVTSGITLTVPSTAEDGQFYWIRNVSGGDVTIAGTNLVGWNSGEVSTSIGLAKSKAAAMYYDKHNNKWFMNWIDCWN